MMLNEGPRRPASAATALAAAAEVGVELPDTELLSLVVVSLAGPALVFKEAAAEFKG